MTQRSAARGLRKSGSHEHGNRGLSPIIRVALDERPLGFENRRARESAFGNTRVRE